MIKIAMWGNSSGSRYWRLGHPAKYLNQTGEFDVRMMTGPIDDESANWADIYVLQGVVYKKGIALLHAYQQEKGKKIVVDSDDYMVVDEDSPFKMENEASNATEIIPITMGIADLVTTTTEYLADDLRKLNKNVAVLPNSMDMDVWDVRKYANDSDVVRIGWTGSLTHLKDLQVAYPALKRIHETHGDKVQFVFMGDPRISDAMPDIPMECSVGVGCEHFPRKLAGLRLDIGIAPLKDSDFNRRKSNIKPLEYGINQIPCIASHVEPYKHFNRFVYTVDTESQWFNTLTMLVEDKKMRRTKGQELYGYVKKEFDLSKNIKKWVKAYKKVL